MQRLKRNIVVLALVTVAIGLGTQDTYAALSYDKYAPIYHEQKGRSKLKAFASDFLTYPFELVRWPVDKTLYIIEENHLHKKAQWLYETVQNYGVTPSLGVTSITDFGAGAEVDFIRVFRQKENLPDGTAKGWVKWTDDVRLKTGGKMGWERIGGSNWRTFGIFDYERRYAEHFYGLGPKSSAGEGSVFGMETTSIEGSIGYSPDPTFSIDLSSGYHNVNISGGRDGGRAQPGTIEAFSFATPGIQGDEMWSLGLDLIHDTRNQKDNSTTGGKRHLGWTYYEGVDGSDASFFRFEVDASQYFRLGSDRRVFVARVYGEHNAELGAGEVPFHQMAKLGGHGRRGTRMSETLRGFAFNRFFDESALLFNLEYRYTIWEYRQFKGDAVAFLDEGQVFNEISDFQFDRFRESYGGGLRFSLANIVLLSLEVAHGDEGTNFFVKTYAPF